MWEHEESIDTGWGESWYGKLWLPLEWCGQYAVILHVECEYGQSENADEDGNYEWINKPIYIFVWARNDLGWQGRAGDAVVFDRDEQGYRLTQLTTHWR